MSEIDTDAAYLRTEQVVLLGEGEPAWAKAVGQMPTSADLRDGAMALLPFLMKRMNDNDWAEALLEARLFQRRMGGKG